jgi:hypothetical protein
VIGAGSPITVLLLMLDAKTGLVASARREAVLSAAVALMSDVGAGFSVVLLVSYVKAVSTTVDVVFLSSGFLVVLVAGLTVAEFSSYVEVASAVIGPGLPSARPLVVVVLSATDVISAGLGAESLVMLVILSGAMFSSFVEGALTGDATARAGPLIPLSLEVLPDLSRAMVEVML